MSQGKIEQVGTPAQIYNFPETEFTAQFVGQINLLPVEVVNANLGVVKLGQQTIQAGQFGHLNGKAVRLAVRPGVKPGYIDGARQSQRQRRYHHISGFDRADSSRYRRPSGFIGCFQRKEIAHPKRG